MEHSFKKSDASPLRPRLEGKQSTLLSSQVATCKNAKTECEGFGEEVLILPVWVHREWNHTAFSKQQGWCENARSRRDREHEH